MSVFGRLLARFGLAAPADPPAAWEEPGYAALNDKLAAGVTPEMNANAFLWWAFGPRPDGGTTDMPAEFFGRLGIDPPPAGGDYFVGPEEFARDRLNLDPERAAALPTDIDHVRVRPWAAEDYPHVAAWLAANEGPLAVVVAAAERPAYFNPLVPDPPEDGIFSALRMPALLPARHAAAALCARALLRAGEGNPEAAWADLLACHRLGRLLGRGGTLLEALVGLAFGVIAADAESAVLGRPGLNADRLRDRLAELRALPPIASPGPKIDLTERLLYLDSLRLVRRKGLWMWDVTNWGKELPEADPEELRALGRVDWGRVARDANRWYDRFVAAYRRPTRRDRLAALGPIAAHLVGLRTWVPAGEALAAFIRENDPADRRVGRVVGNSLHSQGLTTGSFFSLPDAWDRAAQTERNLHVAVALAAYRAEHGRYPEKLAALAPGVLKVVPDDLFSEKPLVYRATPDGYLLYSVGPNGKDDGGRGPLDEPPGDDLAVRMPAAR